MDSLRLLPSEARDLDERDFPPGECLAALMHDTGFGDVQVRRNHRRVGEPRAGFLADARQHHRTAHFIVLADHAYESRLRWVERAVDEDADGAVNSQFCPLTALGEKP